MDDKTKIVKVKAFPIRAQMAFGTAMTQGQILKLTQTGFLLEAPLGGMKTGDKFQITFELPVSRKTVNAQCVTVKLYMGVESHVIEGHFQSLSPDDEQKIMRFLTKIPTKAAT